MGYIEPAAEIAQFQQTQQALLNDAVSALQEAYDLLSEINYHTEAAQVDNIIKQLN